MVVAVIQMGAGPDPAENLERACALVEAAAARGARLVLLPEKWLAIGGGRLLSSLAEPLTGPRARRLAALASALGIDLLAGSLPEAPTAADPDRRPWNTAAHFTPDGRVAAAYRKVHLFDADVGGRRYRESAGERAGDAVVTTTAADGTVVGLSVCFDLRFPGMYAALAARGAEVFVVPAAFTRTTTRAHWEPLLRARAIEHGAWVLAANQGGEHADGSVSGGASMVVSPWGDVVARAPETGEEVVLADLDLGAVSRAREALPTAALARPDVYPAPAPSGGGPMRGHPSA